MKEMDRTTTSSLNELLMNRIADIQRRYEDRIGDLSIIRELGSTLLYLQSFEQVCRFILGVVVRNTVARNCSIMLLDSETDRLFLAAAADPEREPFVIESSRVFSKAGVNYTFEYGKGAAGRALKERRSILLTDTAGSPDFSDEPECRVSIGCLLTVPLIVENLPLGVLNLSHDSRDAFDPEEQKLFEIIAGFVALSIHGSLNYERLKASELKYRSLAEHLSDGVAILQKGVHVYANPAYLGITGLGMDLLGKRSFESLLDPSSSDTYRDGIRSLNRLGTLKHPFEVVLTPGQEERVHVEINASLIEYNGEPAIMVSARDISERKALERRLEEARKMEALGAVAAGVAHDLNNVLSGLVSYPDLMLMEVPAGSPLREPLITVKKSGVKAARIVQDLLSLARRGVEVREVVNLNDIVNEFLKAPECAAFLEYHPHVALKTRLDPALKYIKGSPVHLSKVVMNLVSNAGESMSGPGEVIVSTRNERVEQSEEEGLDPPPGEYAVLSVADQGIGISKDEIQRIFEPFYTKKAMGRSGTGLGMTVVKGTVEDHHGRIDVRSEPGKGTVISIYLPVNDDYESVKTEQEVDVHGRGELILVVDDIKEQGQIASAALQSLGYRTIVALSGEEALEVVKGRSPDLVLLDMIMDPGIDGFETYSRLLRLHPRLPVVIASGYAETDRVRKALLLGSGVFLNKPYTVLDLGKAVRSALSMVRS